MTDRRIVRWVRAAVWAAFLVSCAAPPAPSNQPGVIALPSSTPIPTASDPWTSLLAVTPVPMGTPVPAADTTPIDGLYAKLDPSWPQWWLCLRCADYRPAGGLWRLQFDRGVMRVYYEVTQWRSLASYSVEGDRLTLFNDPYCPYETGVYVWSRSDAGLALQPVRDGCAFDLRARALSEQAWESCPSDARLPEDAPDYLRRGCGLGGISTPAPITGDLPVVVHVFPGDARKLQPPPDAYADANATSGHPPPGASVSDSPESVSYGRHRILWRDDDWVELVMTQPFEAVGVQFLGSSVIGWARVMFDGVTVWQGDTSQLGKQLGQYGGYIEITGYSAGRHTLRVERLEVDTRPVDVLFFGLRQAASGG